jgi:hypothetical protein
MRGAIPPLPQYAFMAWCLLWNPIVHYRVHKSPPLATILSQMQKVHSVSPEFILILSSYLHLALLSGLFPPGFPTKVFYAFIIARMRATCLVYLILFQLITLIVFRETCKLRRSSLCSLLQPSAHFGLNILFDTLFSNTFHLRFSRSVRAKFHTHTKQCENYNLRF